MKRKVVLLKGKLYSKEVEMNRKVFLSLAVMALMVVGSLAGGLLAGSSLAESGVSVPSLIHYQGVLLDPSTGDPVADGGYNFVFSIYNVATGGAAIWSETQTGVTVEDGYFSVLLGSVSSLSVSIFDGTPRYLGIKVGTDAEMTPRQLLASVPYSMQADTLDGLDSSDLDGLYVNESGDEMSGGSPWAVLSVTNAGSGSAVKGSASGTVFGSGIYGVASGSDGKGVLGVATYAGEANNYGGLFEAWGSSGCGVYGEAVNDGDVANYGGYFVAGGERGQGVYGVASGSCGLGVYGEATSGWGVKGTNTDTSNYGILGGASYGVYGQSSSGYGIKGDSASGHGVDGQSSSGWGVYGEATSGWGVEGINSATGNHGMLGGAWYGVYGESGGAGSYAAVFRGNVLIRSRTTGLTIIELGEGLDYAEGFDVSNETEIVPGTVLVIDPDNPGELAISDEPYDRKVAGIVAGANGIGSGVRLGTDEFDYDVALAGRVYCNVDATEAAVKPGDMLTTSATPGYAMKVIDYERASGAILGKAMEGLEEGEMGQILVLVTLQ